MSNPPDSLMEFPRGVIRCQWCTRLIASVPGSKIPFVYRLETHMLTCLAVWPGSRNRSDDDVTYHQVGRAHSMGDWTYRTVMGIPSGGQEARSEQVMIIRNGDLSSPRFELLREGAFHITGSSLRNVSYGGIEFWTISDVIDELYQRYYVPFHR